MKELFDLAGKKAIVTGGTRGLGNAMAEGLMEAGASVCIWGTSEKALTVAESFQKIGLDAHGVVVDISDRKDLERAFHESVAILGGLDILVNAAGTQRRHESPNFPVEDWDWVLEVNLTAPFELSQLAAKEYLKKEKPAGKIINVASILAFLGGFTTPAYSASKGGIAQMTKALCNELAASNIQVNAIAPGYMVTDQSAHLADPANPRYAEINMRIPAHRWGQPADMKGLTVFLASDASNYSNGTVIPLDGGTLVR